MAADYQFKKPRKSNFSPEEIDALVTTVTQNYEVLYGQHAKRFVNKEARHEVWLSVLRQVNQVSLEKRTLQEVKNKWKKCQHMYKVPDLMDFPDDELVNVWEPLAILKDSMPLQQRISHNLPESQEAVLQSQPLSPTKLKVTRQAAKPQLSPKPSTPEPPNEEVCLRWNSHHANMQTSFPNLLLKEQYVDATLVAEGKTLKCHRMILSSCSPYFEEVLNGISPFQHPVLFMKDIPFWILKSLCDFMYAGEVHIFQNKLEELLSVAEALKIKGLAGKTEGNEDDKPPTDQPNEENDIKEPRDEKKKEDKKKQTKDDTPKSTYKPATSKSSHHTPVSKSSQHPSTSKSGHTVNRVQKNKERLIKDENIIDPLDLLEPVYEEITKETKQNTPAKIKEIKHLSVKKTVNKKVKKRRFTDDREESPPPVFQARKGTRSRPNVKIPKYFHSHYEPPTKESSDATIVREPHTNQNDPLIQVVEIKAEPIDVEDDVIEIEDNVVNFSDQEMTSHEGVEEIIGNYDSPIVNIADKGNNKEFKKISLVSQPVIMDVHTVEENTTDTLQIVDISTIGTEEDKAVEENTADSLKIIDVSTIDTQGDKPDENPVNSLKIVDISTLRTEEDKVVEESTVDVLKIVDVSTIGTQEDNAEENAVDALKIVDISTMRTEDKDIEDNIADTLKIVDVSTIESQENKAPEQNASDILKIVDISTIRTREDKIDENAIDSLKIVDVSTIGVLGDKTVSENATDTLEIIDMSTLSSQEDRNSENEVVTVTENDKSDGDPLDLPEKEMETAGIMISNVESVIEKEDKCSEVDSVCFQIENVVGGECSFEEKQDSLTESKNDNVENEIIFTEEIQHCSGDVQPEDAADERSQSHEEKEESAKDDILVREKQSEVKEVQDIPNNTVCEDVNALEESFALYKSTEETQGLIDCLTENELVSEEDNDTTVEEEDIEKEMSEDVMDLATEDEGKEGRKENESCEDVIMTSPVGERALNQISTVNENKLLDLEDDVVMSEETPASSRSKKLVQSPEKTLEMIVNDLNESLEESRKDLQDKTEENQLVFSSTVNTKDSTDAMVVEDELL